MTKTDLINAIKAIDPNAKTWGLDKDELQALLTELQAKAINQEQGQAPADTSSDVVNNGNEVAMQRTPEQMAEDLKKAAFELDAIKSNESENVSRETKPEDLIKNDVAPAELIPAFYVVVEGRAITSKRGILPAGEAVAARDFVGGEETLNSLLERGLIE